MLQQAIVVFIRLRFGMDMGTKTDTALFGTLGNQFFQPGKSSATDKEDVGGIDVDEFLLRVFASALRRHGSNRAFNQFEQGLLHALTRYVTSNRQILALARDFVDFVNVDDAFFSASHVVVAVHQQFLHDGFHVFTNVAGFG